ncbi:MAG: winged helix-turn-helix transcriptional regulator [Deltaproteobacteria bacterium]|nr:winged helix-turn-helix transcriptional regulator [Deltaproteobacteria bacterium]
MEEITAAENDRCENRCIHQERVHAAEKHALPPKENEQLATLFKAMGDPNRLRILWALNYGEMCVCDLAMFIGISESAVSHQLRQLRQLQIVSNRREGPVLYYRLNDNHISALIHLTLEHLREET